mmetsp:Transcript_10250/g.47053  ORF Transcript_10250/g.47053 Transcript_10250/m.47053 type:complete len:320 (-) Transcript_10250:4985-5944(-)
METQAGELRLRQPAVHRVEEDVIRRQAVEVRVHTTATHDLREQLVELPEVVVVLAVGVEVDPVEEPLLCIRKLLVLFYDPSQHRLPPPKLHDHPFLRVPTLTTHVRVDVRVRLDDGVRPRLVFVHHEPVYDAHAEPDVESVSLALAHDPRVDSHQRRLPVHHHRVVLGVQELIVAVVPHRLGEVRQVGGSVPAPDGAQDHLRLHGVVDEGVGEVRVAARAGVLPRAVPFVVQLVPRRSRGEEAPDDVHVSVLARQHQRGGPFAVLETRVRALADERIDRIDVAGRGRSKKPTRRHERCPLNTGRVGTQMWSLANLKCTF